MTRLAARFLPLLMAIGADAAYAQAIPCGEPYTVQRGDTLQRIAVRAYGPDATWRDLIDANRAAFRNGDPSRIEIGQRIVVPCRETRDAAASPEPPAEARPESVGAAVAVDRPSPLVVLGTPPMEPAWTLLHAALSRARVMPPSPVGGGAPADTVAEALGAAGAGALAAPLPRPDCASGEVAELCTALVWSAPLAETVVATFTRAEQGPVTLDAALAGRRVCTVAAIPAAVLTARGPGGDGLLLETAPDAEACLVRLRAGAVDAAILPAAEADDVLAALAPGTAVVEQFALSQLVTLHAVALPSDDSAVAMLARLDAALAEMRDDGSWRAIAAGTSPPR